MLRKIIFAVVLAFLPLAAGAADLVTAEVSTREEGEKLELSVRLTPALGWHIYSHHPGEYGYPTQIFWNLNDYKMLYEEWSQGEDIIYGGLGANVYKKPALYQATLAKSGNKLPSFEITWIACADECIPGSFKFAYEATTENIWWMLLMALGGGILLNFMPCVFPVLFLKLNSFAKATNHKKDAFLYLSGVMVCFLVFAGILATVDGIGWGFHLQSAYFVMFLALVFFILGLMFLDVVQLNSTIKYLPKGSFMTGLFAVVVASPCTAPGMAAAIGWTMTVPHAAYVYFLVFGALGLGYGLPFFWAGLFPQYIRKILPKPGFWMVVLRRVFAIPMFLTSVWLLWSLQPEPEQGVWKVYQAEEVDALIGQGEEVFINFTAKWCITCLVNEQTVLGRDDFVNKAKEKNIHLYKADWTNRDADIAKALAKYGRSGVPLYLHCKNKKCKILPQILKFDVVI